ncbi:MAG: thioredoxin domain-containing protein, partial [Methyloligellaceae bacterium]
TWTAVLDQHYWLGETGGYAMTADDTEALIVRTRAAHDDATPNANAIMPGNLVALFQITGEAAYFERAEALLAAFSGDIARNPIGHTGVMGSAMDVLSPQMLALIGDREPFKAVLRQMSLPGTVVQVMADTTSVPDGSPLAGKTAKDGKPTAYFCASGTCSLPVTDANALEDLLRAGRELQSPPA